MTAYLPFISAMPGPARGTSAPWTLPEDGFVDPIAVEIAASGARRVALTPAERLLAAACILAAGLRQTDIAERLHVNSDTARTLAGQVRRCRLLPVPDLWALAYPTDTDTDTDADTDASTDAGVPAA
ncbi:hypothetical protein [Actinomadura fibrosa]|uniref:HTH luxR-type domain-containing protein n=1 Tax=Actinomadura fibrosa TaxID=111802 RepID=A0ABW2XS76_9ACTN|nr:hypothetical protein [Actinomadura fibrosa]